MEVTEFVAAGGGRSALSSVGLDVGTAPDIFVKHEFLVSPRSTKFGSPCGAKSGRRMLRQPVAAWKMEAKAPRQLRERGAPWKCSIFSLPIMSMTKEYWHSRQGGLIYKWLSFRGLRGFSCFVDLDSSQTKLVSRGRKAEITGIGTLAKKLRRRLASIPARPQLLDRSA